MASKLHIESHTIEEKIINIVLEQQIKHRKHKLYNCLKMM